MQKKLEYPPPPWGSKEAPKNPKVKKQRRRTNLKHRTNISAVSKRLLKTKKWRSLPFLGNRDIRHATVEKGNKAL